MRTNENTIIVRTPTTLNTGCKLFKMLSYSVTLISANPAKIHAKNKIESLSNKIPSLLHFMSYKDESDGKK